MMLQTDPPLIFLFFLLPSSPFPPPPPPLPVFQKLDDAAERGAVEGGEVPGGQGVAGGVVHCNTH